MPEKDQNNPWISVRKRKRKPTIFILSGFLVSSMTFATFSCKPEPVSVPEGKEKWEVVIVGAGAGGLGAGATLSRAGVKPLILEQHDKPGGYMTNFERGDYRFEVSLHMIDGLDPGGMTRELFEKLGILDRVQPVKFDPLYRSVHPDIIIDVPADIDEYLNILKKRFPQEAEGITRLFQSFFDIGDDITGLSQLMDQHFLLRWPKYPLVPLLYWDFFKDRNATIDEIVYRHISDPKAVSVILQLAGFMGTPPSRSPGVMTAVMMDSYHRHGVYHFIGGSQSVSNALAAVIRGNGGEIRLNTLVKKILIQDGRAVGVRTEDGQEIYADYIISNANGYATYLELVGEEHLKPEYVEYVKGLEPGLSATEVFLGLDLDLKKAGLGEIGEIFYSPTYDVEEAWKNIDAMDIEKMPMVIALMSNTDPTCAPPGKSVVIITTGGVYDWQNRWRIDEGYEAYRELKEEVADRMIAVAEKFIPGLRDAIEEIEVGTPLTMERYTLNYKGSIIGWAPTPEQTMLKRMKQKGPIDRLYLAGAWTFPCGGQSACLNSGHNAAKMILGKIR
ncbi:MAG: NAD(P)/FAD-dependent oxidoreductase [Deltaproteobacteria bacterium]|nr:MAG: NAD(P)/FAD-dependent oxidoreductase [Deltaproteobacteria bacterium]